MRYSPERKEAVLKKMLPPNNKSIPEIAIEEGISVQTLYSWRTKARSQGRLLPNGQTSPNGWTSSDMFSAVVETAPLNEEEVAQYCRQKGIYPEQLKHWREACENANDWDRSQSKVIKEQMKDASQKNKELERELRRKEKALAEAAALLVLKKKAQNLWGEGEDE